MIRPLVKRPDGKHEEELGENWVAEYTENPRTGLWEVDIMKHDVPEWHSTDYESLEDARQAARDHYEQV